MSKGKEKFWMKFYPDKWMGDIELRTCSPMARALLIDLMAISFPNGIFTLKTREEKKQFIRQIGFTPIKFERSLNELLNKSRVVFDKNLDKFFIPKMRKDHEEYEIAQQNGKKGGNPLLTGVNPPLNPPLNPEVEVEEEIEEENIKAHKFNDEDLQLARKWGKLVSQSSPSFKLKATHGPQWADVVRLMRECDNRTIEGINRFMDAVHADEFWSNNIKDMKKLRQKINEGKLDAICNLNTPAKPKRKYFSPDRKEISR